jgi:hypothetical protein
MPPNPFALISDIRRAKNPRVPDIFFSASEEEIVEALVALGYSRKAAEAEAQQFMAYKASLTAAKPPDDNESNEQDVPPEYEGFFAAVRRIKARGEK